MRRGRRVFSIFGLHNNPREVQVALEMVSRLGPYFMIPDISRNCHCCHLLHISKNEANALLFYLRDRVSQRGK